ncbi:MAG: hypothetical protein A2086_08815 [Spirochaetes bacterium GWD1_27_9]|nr:MAG: hypothetical protein A2Z98_11180 [Spirochaetes bacterium GWB1_27_13]OHD21628.1 MAG: hypothetical protein A2Y34_15105 [Spirochaetes bacterium GWC1_27_15]OHD37952.1 MAG: hypothetical protein A2086_08815 [Spirochaetes bacterium GWD1_27_9]
MVNNEELDKMYKIREQLRNTYKITSNKDQKDRIGLYLNQIESIIKDLESGKWINPVKLNIISEDIKKESGDDDGDDGDDDSSLKYDVEIKKISDKFNDSEMDGLYSYFNYFENNFLPPLSQSYLRLDYNLGKKREDVFVKTDLIRLLIKQYIEDAEVLKTVTRKEQIESFRERLANRKKQLFIKIGEYLHDFEDFVDNLIGEMNLGRKNILNANEKYATIFELSRKSILEGKKFKDIITETKIFLNEFLKVLRLPDFRKF